MKPLHIGLLVFGAALAGGLAMRLAAPPPLPAGRPARQAPVASNKTPAAAASVPAPAAETSVAAPPALQQVKPEVAPAPPVVYSEPPHVEQPARRKPFGENTIAAAHAPPHAEPPHSPAIPPIGYKPPADAVTPSIEAKAAMAPAPIPEPVEPPRSEPPHAAPTPRQVALRAGASITIRLVESLSTEGASSGQVFQATLADPLICDGLIVAERGARVTGRITDAKQAGRFGGVSLLELRLINLTTADGQRIAISSDPWLKRGDSAGRGSAAKIGGGAALGAVIGAIAGGGLGAAIGAGAGGGAGAGVAAITGARPVRIPSETVIRFRLASTVKITERQL